MSHLTSFMSNSRQRDGHFTSYLSGSKHIAKMSEQEETTSTETSHQLNTSTQLTFSQKQFASKKGFETSVIPEHCGEMSSTFL